MIGKVWVKKENPEFDVPMGSFDGAEICEIVGLYILEKLINSNIGLSKERTGLYRDDGRNGEVELLRINITNIQGKVGKTQIQHNKQEPGRNGPVCEGMGAEGCRTRL